MLRRFTGSTGKLFTRDVTWRMPTSHLVILLAIVVLSLDLRLQSVIHTVVDEPIRADAHDYFTYAYNLHQHGIYSRTFTPAGTLPEPDALRPPAYPLFLYPFMSAVPDTDTLRHILIAQALISTLTVILTFLIARLFIPATLALGAAALTALSPHLVTMNVYVLTETLFTFLIVLLVWLIGSNTRGKRWLWLVAGLALGAATLTRPTMQYFLLPLSLYLWYQTGWRTAARDTAFLVLGMALVMTPWVVRNAVTLDRAGDNTLLIGTLHHGTYPDFMYNDDPRSFAIPYRFDPRTPEITKDIRSVLAEIKRRFDEDRSRTLHWYLIGKPRYLFDWDLIEGGVGDVFVYAVISTPYSYLPHFRLSHAVMKASHGVLVILGLLGVVLVWLPRSIVALSERAQFTARLVSVLILYYVGLHMIGAPYSRYSVPLRPFIYTMALATVFFAYHQVRSIIENARRTDPVAK